MTDDEANAVIQKVSDAHRPRLLLMLSDADITAAEWLDDGGLEELYGLGYLPRPGAEPVPEPEPVLEQPKQRKRHPGLDRGRYVVPKDLLPVLERVAHHQDRTIRQVITAQLYLLETKYKNLPKLPPPPAPPPPPPPEDINPLFSEEQREWIKGQYYVGKRGTDYLGNKYTDELWLEAVLSEMAKEALTGERHIKAANGTCATIRVHAGTESRTQEILPSDQRLTDNYNAWVNGGYQGPEPPRPYQNMQYYGFKKRTWA